MAVERIMQMEDPVEFSEAIAHYLSEKCEYGEAMDRLSEPERVLYVAQVLEMEVNNGGFEQYFYNPSGNDAGEIVRAFEQIGAVNTARICERALSVFENGVPVDWDERQELLEKMESDEILKIWDECSSAFCAYDEDLYELYFAYAMKNAVAFR